MFLAFKRRTIKWIGHEDRAQTEVRICKHFEKSTPQKGKQNTVSAYYIPNNVLSILHILIHLIPWQPNEADSILIPILNRWEN